MSKNSDSHDRITFYDGKHKTHAIKISVFVGLPFPRAPIEHNEDAEIEKPNQNKDMAPVASEWNESNARSNNNVSPILKVIKE